MLKLIVLGRSETDELLRSLLEDSKDIDNDLKKETSKVDRVDGIIAIADHYDAAPNKIEPWNQRNANKASLDLYFLDIEEHGNKSGPTADHVAMGLEYARQMKDGEVLLVCCFAGRSRSTAMAAVILCEQLLRVEKISKKRVANVTMAELLKIRPGAIPNMELLRHGDDKLGLDGRLIAAGRRLNAIAKLKEDRRFKGYGGMY